MSETRKLFESFQRNLNEKQDPEEGFEIDEELVKQCDDIHYRGIFTTYIEDTNTLLFTKEKGENAIYNDADDIDTIVYRNQTPEQIKKIIDDLVDSNKKDSVIKESITVEYAEDFINKLEYCEDEEEIQDLIYEIPDGVLEDICQLALDQCIQDGDDLDAIKSHVQVTFEDNAEYEDDLDESNLNEDDKKMLSGDETYVSKNQFNFSILGLIINNKTKQFQFVNGQTMPLNKHKKLTSKALRQKAKDLRDQGYEEYKGYGSISLDESTLNESGANLDIDLNTGILPIINVDMYSLSDRLPDSASLEELDEIIKDIAPKYIEETIQEVLPSAKIIANKVYHPSQYNYSGDELEFNLTVNQDEYENLRKEALSNSEFENFLKSNYSSRSGFISSMPNNIEDFNRSETWKSMVQVIMFALRNTDLDSVNDNYLDEFMEEVNQNFDFEEYDESALNEEIDYNNCVYQLVGGDYAGTYTREEAEKLPIKEDKLSPNYSEYRNKGGVVPREELDDQLQFKGYLGPMYNGTDKDGKHIIRYETQEVYDMMSESDSSNKKYSYKKTLEKELEKVQNSIGNAAPDKNISGLEDKRDWLMWKLDQLDEGDSLEKVRKDSIEKGLLSEDYNPLNVKLFMNTWGNYNENGADVDSIGGGWMDIEQVRDFLEKHSNEEPFINDVDGEVPFEINEYSNVEQVLEWLEAYENLSENEQEAFTALMEDQNDDFEGVMDILESGDYIFFSGVETEFSLGEAWVDMVGGIEGVSNPENYIDEDAYRESWREVAESSVREDNPDIDEDSDEFYDLVEEWLDSVVDEQLQLDIDEGRDLSDYFDYEALGRDLDFDGFYFASTGAVQVL